MMSLTFFDAATHLDNQELQSLLALAAGLEEEEELDALLRTYAGERFRLIGAVDLEERLAGLLGLELAPDGSARLHHLIVQPGMRRRGVGRALVERAMSTLRPLRLDGRCTEDVLPFFTALGFDSRIVGAVPPGRILYGVRRERVVG